MSESPTDDQPVLDAIARSARRLCGADQVWLNLIDGHEVVNVAADGVPGEWRRSRGPIDPASSFAYVIREQRVVQFCGYDDPLLDRFPAERTETARLGAAAGGIVALVRSG